MNTKHETCEYHKGGLTIAIRNEEALGARILWANHEDKNADEDEKAGQ